MLYKRTNPVCTVVPAEIQSWERTLEVVAGDDITITCEATGHPPPNLAWTRSQSGHSYT